MCHQYSKLPIEEMEREEKREKTSNKTKTKKQTKWKRVKKVAGQVFDFLFGDTRRLVDHDTKVYQLDPREVYMYTSMYSVGGFGCYM